MRLIISKEYNTSATDDVYKLGTSMLQMSSTHMFIASHVWDSIHIELSDDIPEMALTNFNINCSHITCKLPDTVTDKTLRLLCELYPDMAGKLRRTYMAGGDIGGLLPNA